MNKLQWVAGTLCVALAGCGDDTGSSGASGSAGQSSSGDAATTDAPPTSGVSDTQTGTESTVSGASNTQGMTTTPPTSTTTEPTGTNTEATASNSDPTATDTAATDTGTDTSTTSGVMPDTTTGGSDSSTSIGESASDSDSSTGEPPPPPPCEPGDIMGGGMGQVEKSYIWISSHNLHEMSKVDTVTMTELARYKTGPGAQNPSRTAVSSDGRFVIVNNRDGGRTTMVAANPEDCIDKNGNGQIDTSQNPANILAFGADECVIWSVVLPVQGSHQSGPRGVTWTPGDWDYNLCKYVDPKVWVGYLAVNQVAHFVRIDGETGVVEETLMAPGWKGASGFGPYGAALDPQFRPWFSSLRNEFVRVNTDQNPITLTRIDPPAWVQSYGLTIDRDGDVWFGGWSGPVTVYDPKAQTFTAIAGTSGAHRGVAADENFVWAAHNSPCELIQVDRKQRTLIAKHVPNPCTTAIGLSIDVEDNVWLIDQNVRAWKFAPDNVPGMQSVNVLGSHYVYSDMTGGQLRSVLPQ